jgi:hypothetical protein
VIRKNIRVRWRGLLRAGVDLLGRILSARRCADRGIRKLIRRVCSRFRRSIRKKEREIRPEVPTETIDNVRIISDFGPRHIALLRDIEISTNNILLFSREFAVRSGNVVLQK